MPRRVWPALGERSLVICGQVQVRELQVDEVRLKKRGTAAQYKHAWHKGTKRLPSAAGMGSPGGVHFFSSGWPSRHLAPGTCWARYDFLFAGLKSTAAAAHTTTNVLHYICPRPDTFTDLTRKRPNKAHPPFPRLGHFPFDSAGKQSRCRLLLWS